jgi:cysteine-rich repeat protein
MVGSVLLLGAAGVVACLEPPEESSTEQFVQMSGAIFTTNRTGQRVNQNIYEAKRQVWLDGGPGPGAPVGAAGLPAGFYFFQVTDPSGKDLLSTDPVNCRRVEVNAFGVISAYAPLPVQGVTCFHLTDIDTDHALQGAITVQLIPFLDTTNPGGEYKVWFSPDPAFPNNQTKTDNFKVLEVTPPPVCGDGMVNQPSETCDDGNQINDDACRNDCTFCGDGITNGGEECDDGNTNNTDACDNTCKICPVEPK